jgi:isopenicillin N synthase-like dioxygenase
MEQSIQINEQLPLAEQIRSKVGQRAEIVSEDFAEMPIIDFRVFLASQASPQDETMT